MTLILSESFETDEINGRRIATPTRVAAKPPSGPVAASTIAEVGADASSTARSPILSGNNDGSAG